MKRDTDGFHILVDSDALVGNFYPDDIHHQRSVELFTRYEQTCRHMVTTSLVILETATVLSHKSGQALARQFLVEFVKRDRMDIIHITEELQEKTLDLFLEETKKGTSMTDCANVVVMHRFGIPTILSFDAFYTKRYHLQTAA